MLSHESHGSEFLFPSPLSCDTAVTSTPVRTLVFLESGYFFRDPRYFFMTVLEWVYSGFWQQEGACVYLDFWEDRGCSDSIARTEYRTYRHVVHVMHRNGTHLFNTG